MHHCHWYLLLQYLSKNNLYNKSFFDEYCRWGDFVVQQQLLWVGLSVFLMLGKDNIDLFVKPILNFLKDISLIGCFFPCNLCLTQEIGIFLLSFLAGSSDLFSFGAYWRDYQKLSIITGYHLKKNDQRDYGHSGNANRGHDQNSNAQTDILEPDGFRTCVSHSLCTAYQCKLLMLFDGNQYGIKNCYCKRIVQIINADNFGRFTMTAPTAVFFWASGRGLFTTRKLPSRLSQCGPWPKLGSRKSLSTSPVVGGRSRKRPLSSLKRGTTSERGRHCRTQVTGRSSPCGETEKWTRPTARKLLQLVTLSKEFPPLAHAREDR